MTPLPGLIPTLRLLGGVLAALALPSSLSAIKPANSDVLELERFTTPDPAGLQDLKDLDRLPVPQFQARPEFPAHLRAATIKAEVLVGFIVNTVGEVSHAYAVRSDNPWFERASVEAVRRWRFNPGVVEGRAVNTRMQVPITFALEASDGGAWGLRLLTDTSKLPEQMRYDTPPTLRSTTFAVYPFEALLEKQEATVSLRALVDATGKVAQIVFSDGPDERFRAAVRAMLDHWRFKPAAANGQPVPTVVFMEFRFAAKGDSCAPLAPAARDILAQLGKAKPRFEVLADLDEAPQLIAHHLPVHPPALREAGVGGRALVELFIDETGAVQLPRVIETTHPELGYAAAQAVATWWFKPPMRDGRPVTVRTRVPVIFAVEDKDAPQ